MQVGEDYRDMTTEYTTGSWVWILDQKKDTSEKMDKNKIKP